MSIKTRRKLNDFVPVGLQRGRCRAGDGNNNNEDDSTWHASIVVRLVILGAAMVLLVVSRWMGRQWTARIQQHQFQSVRQQDEEEEGDEHGYHEISMTDIGTASGAVSA